MEGGREFVHFVGVVIPGSYLLLSGSPLNDYILSIFLPLMDYIHLSILRAFGEVFSLMLSLF